jgi:hypothetical protein
MMTRKAMCCCGATSIQVKGDPTINAICHCRNCQRRTGSAFGWSAYFTNDQVMATLGAFRTYSVPASVPGRESRQERVFCGTCGTTLFWRSRDFEGLVGVAGGCFTETPLPEPTMSVENETRCAWVGLPEGWDVLQNSMAG